MALATARTKGGFAKTSASRMTWVLLFFYASCALLLGRLFFLQIVHHGDYARLAAKQHQSAKTTSGERGTIAMQDRTGALIPLAFNRIEQTLAASPRNVTDARAAAAFVADAFEIQADEVQKKLEKRDDLYEVLVKKVDAKRADSLAPGLPEGLFFEEEKRRAYPHGTLGAHVVGFVSKEESEEVGRYGLERFYERELTGKTDFFAGAERTKAYWLSLGKKIVNPPKNGSDIVLTIDYNIQLKAEEALRRAAEKWSASSGAILVVEPATGKIRALAGVPAFDPNEFSKETDFSVFLNRAVEAQYELGSVMKPLTMATALEEGKVRPTTTYEDMGSVRFGGYKIQNFDLKAHGVQTMSQVIEKSLNTGMVYVARQIGKDAHLEFLRRFGLGEKTGVDLPGELAGDISNLSEGRDIDFATASFGQGIAVTPLQTVMALAAIANHGVLMKPYVLERITDDSGNEVRREPETVRRVISAGTAEELTKMLVATVRNSFENRAKVKGYFVAGKTGTAQIPREDGRGYSDDVIHTFVGYAPAFEPKFLVYIQLNKPKGNRFAANTLTPFFHDLAEYMLNYYEIPPDEK